MLGIKKLDIYVIKNFCLLFAGTFFVCLFVFMMQFLWRYVDELIGKGLTFDVLAKFFFYSGLTLIPMSLPLAILLAALISFGNMGERLELLAIRAAGISLIKIFRPLIVIVAFLSCMSFYFQNVIGPASYIKLYTLIWSMKQTSPELEIPEGAFYNEIQGYNVYVKHKDQNTGMLKDVMIYTLGEGFENARIILADSGRLDMSADKQHLVLSLYSGEQFENLQNMNAGAIHVPYRRETFKYKQTIIDFNTGFQMQDASFLSSNSSTKGMTQIQADIDSMNVQVDSLGTTYYRDLNISLIQGDEFGALSLNPSEAGTNIKPINPDEEQENVEEVKKKKITNEPFDTLMERARRNGRQDIVQSAMRQVSNASRDLEFKQLVIRENERLIARHWAEWHRKFSLSLACLVFFFIGAPLGAIIRKGGLGMPVIISVIIFIIYYIIDNTAYRQAISLQIPVWIGMWLSTIILAPVGIFLTYKSNQDSTVFNIDAYKNFFQRIFGIRSHRAITLKEVIIETPDYSGIQTRLDELEVNCRNYAEQAHLLKPPSYLKLFWRNEPDEAVQQISNNLEQIILELGNSRNKIIVGELNELPVLDAHAHTSPFATRWKNAIAGIVLPVGAFLYFRIWRYRIRLLRDMRQIIKSKEIIQTQINKIINN